MSPSVTPSWPKIPAIRVSSPPGSNAPLATPKFQGYAAMPLDGLYLQPSCRIEERDVFQELKAIGDREGFKVYSQVEGKLYEKPSEIPVINTQDLERNPKMKAFLEEYTKYYPEVKNQTWIVAANFVRWGQDNKLFLRDDTGKMVLAEPSGFQQGVSDFAESLSKLVGLKFHWMQSRLQGGNVFLGFKKDRSPYVLVGSDVIEQGATLTLAASRNKLGEPQGPVKAVDVADSNNASLNHWNARKSAIRQLAADLFVNPSQIHVISQPEFHLDVMLRPLTYPKVLINDFDLGYELLEEAREQSKDPEERRLLERLLAKTRIYEIDLKARYQATADDLEEELDDAGFEAVRVPGVFAHPRWSEKRQHRTLNFINSVVHQRPDGNLVYITNDSGLPTLNRLFEQSLKERCPNIAKVDFVSGPKNGIGKNYLLECLEMAGGIHCMVAERPKLTR